MLQPQFLGWLKAPRADRSMQVLRGKAWTRFGYDELAAHALGVSAQLRDGGVDTGRVVAILALRRRHLGGGVIVEAEARPIPRTMSGKPRRREIWRQVSEERVLGTIG